MPKHDPVISVSPTAEPIPLFAQEKIIFQSRPHLVVTAFFILAIVLTTVIILAILIGSSIFDQLAGQYKGLGVALVAIALLLVSLSVFLYWLNTSYVLTDRRLEWRFGILGKGVISVSLKNIQNIFIKVPIIGRVFDFGTLTIEPAGITRNITFSTIPAPNQKRSMIEEAILALRN